MKLSTAILNGCKLRPRKCRQAFYRGTESACVLGAAVLGAGLKPVGGIYKLTSKFPVLAGEPILGFTGESSKGATNLILQLIAMNDTTNWSRERIAKVLAEAGL